MWCTGFINKGFPINLCTDLSSLHALGSASLFLCSMVFRDRRFLVALAWRYQRSGFPLWRRLFRWERLLFMSSFCQFVILPFCFLSSGYRLLVSTAVHFVSPSVGCWVMLLLVWVVGVLGAASEECLLLMPTVLSMAGAVVPQALGEECVAGLLISGEHMTNFRANNNDLLSFPLWKNKCKIEVLEPKNSHWTLYNPI